MPDQRTDRIFDSVQLNTRAYFDWLVANNEFVHRTSRSVIEEVQTTQQERLEIIRQWFATPTDVRGLLRTVQGTWAQERRRRSELARAFLGDLRQRGSELPRLATLEQTVDHERTEDGSSEPPEREEGESGVESTASVGHVTTERSPRKTA